VPEALGVSPLRLVDDPEKEVRPDVPRIDRDGTLELRNSAVVVPGEVVEPAEVVPDVG